MFDTTSTSFSERSKHLSQKNRHCLPPPPPYCLQNDPHERLQYLLRPSPTSYLPAFHLTYASRLCSMSSITRQKVCKLSESNSICLSRNRSSSWVGGHKRLEAWNGRSNTHREVSQACAEKTKLEERIHYDPEKSLAYPMGTTLAVLPLSFTMLLTRP